MEQHVGCPGCGRLIPSTRIACAPCWKSVPGSMKARLGQQAYGTGASAREAKKIQKWLKANGRAARTAR